MPEPLIQISRHNALAFACFLVFYEFLTYIANDMIMPGMVEVVRGFHAPESYVSHSLTIYLLGGASLQLILGPVSDAYGRRPPMLIGACLFFIFTVLISVTVTMNQFLIARFFQGMGLCFIGVIGYATIQELFEEMDAVRIIAIMANAAILAPLLGPVLGAVVIHYASWRLIFVFIAIGALIALAGLWRFMPELIGKTTRTGTIIPRVPFSVEFIKKNYSDLLTHPAFCFSALAVGVVGTPCIVWIALAPIIMIVQAKLTVIEYGLWQLPVFGATILGNWVLNRLTYRYKLKPILYLGCSFISVGVLLMAILPYCYGNDYHYLLPGIIIYFFSLSLIHAPLNRLCLYITPVSKGTASALISISVMIVGAIGIELGNLVYHDRLNLSLGLYCSATIGLFLILISLMFKYDTNTPEDK